MERILAKFRELVREDGFWRAVRLALRYAYGRVRLFYLRRIRRASEAVCRVNDYRMITMPNGRGIAEELILLGTHEKGSTREIRRNLRPGSHVIDIGANIGYYALLEAKQIGAEGKVYAIEPVPENYALLERNVELNGLGGTISTHPVAIGDRRGEATMNLHVYMSRHSFLGVAAHDDAGSVVVPMMTFAEFVEENDVDLDGLALVRMDLEGYEAKILPNMVETLRGRKGVSLLMEFHPAFIGQSPECSLTDALGALEALSDRFRWLLAGNGPRKFEYRDLRVDEVRKSEFLMSRPSMHVWLTVEK